MAKIVKKSFPWFVVLVLAGLVVGAGLNFSFGFKISEVKAGTADTSVNVENVVPSITVATTDSSTAASPTDAGLNVTFAATATDNNSDQWKLLVCKTDGTTGTDCDGGVSDRWCISVSAVNSGSENTCAYTTLTGDAESNDWYSYACDATACSTPAETTNSPFYVNHRPRFSYQANTGPKDPTVSITITTAGEGSTTATNAETAGTGVVVEVDSTAGFAVNDYVWYAGTSPERTQVTAVVAGTSLTMTLAQNHAVGDTITEIGCEDTDTVTAADTVSLFVCKAADFTGTACGAAGPWCSVTGAARNPACSFNVPRPDGAWSYYPYVIDNHNFASTDTLQGSTQSYTVSDVAPSIAAATVSLLDIDELDNLTLATAEGATTGFKVKFTVVDNNSCVIKGGTPGTDNEIASAFINVRMSEVTQANCTTAAHYNANQCYPDAETTWTPTCTQDAGTCTAETDTDAAWTCTFPLQYHADPTVTGTPKVAYNWVAAVQATDDNNANTGLVDGSGTNEMDKFMAYGLTTTTIGYGSIVPGADSAQQTTTVKATGNVGLDQNLSGGTDGPPYKGMCVTAYPGCPGAYIETGQQKHNLTSGLGWGDAGAVALTYAVYESELNCLKTTVTNTPETKSTYWYLRVPDPQAAGSYTGQNTIEGKVDNENYGA